MEHRFDLRLLLNQLAGDLRAQARAGSWTVRNIDAINAMITAETRSGDFPGSVHAARRQNFDERDKLSGSQLCAQLRLFAYRHFGQALDFRFRVLSNRNGWLMVLHGLKRPDLAADLLNVLRRGAAAAANHPHTRLQKAARVL